MPQWKQHRSVSSHTAIQFCTLCKTDLPAIDYQVTKGKVYLSTTPKVEGVISDEI